METVIGAFVSIVVLIVITWIAIFGGIGALLARSRGGSVPAGLAWGSGLGPVGWLVILWTTRTQRVALDVEPAFSARGTDISTTRSTAPGRWDPWNR